MMSSVGHSDSKALHAEGARGSGVGCGKSDLDQADDEARRFSWRFGETALEHTHGWVPEPGLAPAPFGGCLDRHWVTTVSVGGLSARRIVGLEAQAAQALAAAAAGETRSVGGRVEVSPIGLTVARPDDTSVPVRFERESTADREDSEEGEVKSGTTGWDLQKSSGFLPEARPALRGAPRRSCSNRPTGRQRECTRETRACSPTAFPVTAVDDKQAFRTFPCLISRCSINFQHSVPPSLARPGRGVQAAERLRRFGPTVTPNDALGRRWAAARRPKCPSRSASQLFAFVDRLVRVAFRKPEDEGSKENPTVPTAAQPDARA